MMEDILNSRYFKYSTSDLRDLIVMNNEQSDEVAFYLIKYRMLPVFKSIYDQYDNLPDELGDALNDFWLYLRNGKTGKNSEPFKGLQEITSLALGGWLKRTFKNFLIDRNNRNERQTSANVEYQAQDDNDAELREKQILDFSLVIAWIHQLSTPDQRFILYRHLMQNICHQDLIDNKKMADALGLTYGNYRTRNSRLSDKIQELSDRIQKGERPELNSSHKILAKQIDESFGQLHTLLKSLYEENLPSTTHWLTIQTLRKKGMEEDANVKFSIRRTYNSSIDEDQTHSTFEEKQIQTLEQENEQLEKVKQNKDFDFSDLSPRKTALKRFKDCFELVNM